MVRTWCMGVLLAFDFLCLGDWLEGSDWLVGHRQ